MGDTIKNIFKTISMILSLTIFSLLLLIIGFLAYYLICTNIYASKGEKFEPKFSLYTIVSPSMEPNIKVYDVILNTKINDPEDIKVGDVITFLSTSNISNGMTVTHRVTKIVQGPNGFEYKTKGDNNLSEDTDTAKYENVLGKVLLKIPQLGRLQFFISSKGGWLIVIVCPALFIIVNDIFKILKLSKAKKDIDEVKKEVDNEEKLQLESFRKQEIKERLNKKELEKAKKIENDLKNRNKNEDYNDKEEVQNNKSDEKLVEKDNNVKENNVKNNNKNKAKEKKSKKAKKANKSNKNHNNEIKKDNVSKPEEELNIFGEKKVENNIFSDNNKKETKTNSFELPKLK